MKTDIYIKLQKKFGGKWVATSKTGRVVYAVGKTVDKLFEKYGQTSVYLSLSIQKK
jgi:phosphopantetheinyl transferase (holo-ACP synthase)